jgi:hypothetical protein
MNYREDEIWRQSRALYSPNEKQKKQYEENQADISAWIISPLPAFRPQRQASEDREQKQSHQDDEHLGASFVVLCNVGGRTD